MLGNALNLKEAGKGPHLTNVTTHDDCMITKDVHLERP